VVAETVVVAGTVVVCDVVVVVVPLGVVVVALVVVVAGAMGETTELLAGGSLLFNAWLITLSKLADVGSGLSTAFKNTPETSVLGGTGVAGSAWTVADIASIPAAARERKTTDISTPY
jgi:hypothetical protein